MRLVIDTNLIVSSIINPFSPVLSVVLRVIGEHTPLYSDETMLELLAVLGKPKLARYVSQRHAMPVVHAYQDAALYVPAVPPVVACRDPKDDKFLSLAVAGSAEAIVTGDDDLLVLHPFRGIDVLTPAAIAKRL